MTSLHLHPHSAAAGVLTHHDTYGGIHWPADPDGHDPPAGWRWVERCDECAPYDDEHAAIVLTLELGLADVAVSWFDRETLERVPHYRSVASVTIQCTPKEV